MTVSLTVSKIYPQMHLGKGFGLARSGNVWGFTFCGTESLCRGSTHHYSVDVHGAASCRGKKNVNYHIDRHDDTRCTPYTDQWRTLFCRGDRKWSIWRKGKGSRFPLWFGTDDPRVGVRRCWQRGQPQIVLHTVRKSVIGSKRIT